jgi:hypothetical protein
MVLESQETLSPDEDVVTIADDVDVWATLQPKVEGIRACCEYFSNR